MTNAPNVGPLFLDALNEELIMSVRGLGGVALQLSGTWVGTVSFEATVDGNTWVAFNMAPSNSATAASSATSGGAWSANCAGYDSVKARVSAYTSGTVKAVMQGTEAAGRY